MRVRRRCVTLEDSLVIPYIENFDFFWKFWIFFWKFWNFLTIRRLLLPSIKWGEYQYIRHHHHHHSLHGHRHYHSNHHNHPQIGSSGDKSVKLSGHAMPATFKSAQSGRWFCRHRHHHDHHRRRRRYHHYHHCLQFRHCWHHHCNGHHNSKLS